MLKEERQSIILQQLANQMTIRVSDITESLKVTEMTVRRDLKELEKKGQLKRIHGGATSIDRQVINHELSHLEKKAVHIEEKNQIAKSIAAEIEVGDTVFFGAGTTIELVYEQMTCSEAKIVTNSIHVFNKFKNDARYEVLLIGGSYRSKTGAFVGSIANDTLKRMHVAKSFIGVNGINGNIISNSNESEGDTQRIALENALKKYIVADHHKLNLQDFYHFYDLSEIDCLITDSGISKEDYEKYHEIVDIIK